jgi:hypothetical protein
MGYRATRPRRRRLNTHERTALRKSGVAGPSASKWKSRVRCAVGLIVVPLIGVALSGVGAWIFLSSDSPPEAPVVGFDLVKGRVLDDFSFRTFAGRQLPGAADQFRPADSIEVVVDQHGCDRWADVEVTIYADPRWWMAVKAARERHTFRPAVRYEPGGIKYANYGRPKVDDSFAFSVSGAIRDPRASTYGSQMPIPLSVDRSALPGTIVMLGRIPPKATRRALINDHIAPSIHLAFQAPWKHTRSPGTCWVTTPRLTGGGAGVSPLGLDGLSGSLGLDAGPRDGVTAVSAAGGRVLRDESDPPPRQGTRPSWACTAEPARRNGLAYRPTCAAAVAIAKPASERWAQLGLLLTGGLLSASIVGLAAGIRRIWLRP